MEKKLILLNVERNEENVTLFFQLTTTNQEGKSLSRVCDKTYKQDSSQETGVYLNQAKQDLKEVFVRLFSEMEKSLSKINQEIDTSFLEF